MSSNQSQTLGNKQQKKLSKKQWVLSARKTLIKEGVQSISLRKLSKTLSVTTGAFYWHYKNLEELLDELRDDWVQLNTNIFTDIFENKNLSGDQKWLAYAKQIIIEEQFNPKYDNAIRDWAATSKKTAQLVKKIDKLRVQQLTQMFVEMGFDSERAVIRARVTYFHQCGYYAMSISQTTEERLKSAPLYAEVLIGKNVYSSFKDIEAIKEDLEKG